MKDYKYHQWTLKDIERIFKVNFKKGLSSREAFLRLKKNGPNSIQKIRDNSFIKIFFRQFTNFFIILLIVAGFFALYAGDVTQCIILFLIVIVNVIIGFFQEYKAERSLEALKGAFNYKAKVVRDENILEVNSEDLVLGDIVLISEGDKIPADLRLIEEDSLRIDESSLTGESVPMSKKISILDIDTPLADRRNMAYSGTTVCAGRGRGVVVACGFKTEFGKIASLISVSDEKTPLEKRIFYMGKIISFYAILISIIIFILGVYRGWEVITLSTFTIALLVAAVPESLPTVTTLALAIGVTEMVKRKAIVRRLAVIEALAGVNIIATDKTGTLTENKLAVTELGYFNDEKFITKTIGGENKFEEEILRFSAFCSDASGQGIGEFVGDPLEVAILNRLDTTYSKSFHLWQKFERVNEIPFSSDRKFMMVSGKIENSGWTIAKGAPEAILKFCSLDQGERREIEKLYKKMLSEGLRIIAVCRKKIGREESSDLKNMKFLGILGFSDIPAPGVAEAIAQTISAGIRPIIITGDHPETAKHIANQIGFRVSDRSIISGSEISKLSDRELGSRVLRTKIFARATPEDKIRIVEILEKNGFSVAVTGDGVNDAPALKTATVGIAMGKRGSDVSKEAADIVLADDNYATIVAAIAWGRTIYDNLKNAVVFLLAGNFDALFLIIFAFIFNLPAPLTTVQILWVNLVTDSLPAIALSFEKPSAGILNQPPRSEKKESIRGPMIYAICLGGIGFIFSTILYLWGLHFSTEKAKTLVFVFLALMELAFIFSIRSKARIWQKPRDFFDNKFLNVSIVISLFMLFVVFLKPFRAIFSIEVISGIECLVLFGFLIAIFFLAEIIRYFLDRRN